jgi:hypothetical protein
VVAVHAWQLTLTLTAAMLYGRRRCELRDNVALKCGGVIYSQRPSRLAADRSNFASNRELDCQAGARMAAATIPAPSSSLGCVRRPAFHTAVSDALITQVRLT